MNIPFTIEAFLNVFRQYNLTIWPIQFFLYGLAALALVFLFNAQSNSHKLVNTILAFFWLWMGIVYHLMFFSSINPLAYFFGIVFIIQGIIFIYLGVIRSHTLQYQFQLDLTGVLGSILIVYALVIYPILAYNLGHKFPETPTFGLPCPTTIFTFGILLFSLKKVPWYIFIIPLLWSLIGFSAALQLSIKEDFGLVIAGILSVIAFIFSKSKSLKLS